eukprot:scaffold7154_cov82-Phaeocystis_antarctica.AAC.1
MPGCQWNLARVGVGVAGRGEGLPRHRAHVQVRGERRGGHSAQQPLEVTRVQKGVIVHLPDEACARVVHHRMLQPHGEAEHGAAQSRLIPHHGRRPVHVVVPLLLGGQQLLKPLRRAATSHDKRGSNVATLDVGPLQPRVPDAEAPLQVFGRRDNAEHHQGPRNTKGRA